MRIPRAWAALASTIAIGAAVLAAAAPAYANQTDAFYIRNSTGTGQRLFLITTDGLPEVDTVAIPPFWSNINGETWSVAGGSRPVFEWQSDAGAHWCLTSAGSGQPLIMQPCRAADNAELWWQTTNGQFVNVEATDDNNNVAQCMNADHFEIGSRVDVLACKSKSQAGWWDQFWTSIT